MKAAGGVDEKQIVKWANKQVADKDLHIKKLRDKSLTNCQFYFAVITSVLDKIATKDEHIVIDEDLVETGNFIKGFGLVFQKRQRQLRNIMPVMCQPLQE